jgi:urease accessory protein
MPISNTSEIGLRAVSVLGRGSWSQRPADCVVLDFDERHRRRVAMIAVQGTNFLLDLAQATALRGGDALMLDDGRLIEVVAAPEPLAEITSKDEAALARIAWHLGNRHLPIQLAGRRLRLRRDHVIEAMVLGLGGKVITIEAPFDPEGGAYAEGGHAGHDHGAHDHAHEAHEHVHDEHCGHDHDHHDHGHHHHHD